MRRHIIDNICYQLRLGNSPQTSAMPQSCKNGAHILLFPFPTSGHIIPFLDLANQLLARGLTITILVTPLNLPLLEPLLTSHHSSSLQTLVLPFPNPPSSSNVSLPANVHASSELSKPILEWFQSHTSPPVAIISDFFLGWTNRLASQMGVQRLVFWPSAVRQSLLIDYLWRYQIVFADGIEENPLISFPDVPNSPVLPRWQMSELSGRYKKGDPIWEFFRDGILANIQSWGAVYNSYTELEGVYINHVKKEMGHDRVWTVGPLLPASDNQVGSSERGGSSVLPLDEVITWLDTKPDNSVVYVCFGSRAELSSEQIDSLAAALESSKVDFIWCVKLQGQGKEGCISKEYEDRVGERGLIIRGWAPQVAILRHRAVGAFLTHCGWNSTLEGLAAGVVMLTWPMGADQFANAQFLVDDLGVAIKACEGGTKNVPNPDHLANIFVESLSGACPKRERVFKLRDAASMAVQSRQGSSSKDLDLLANQLNALKA